MVKAEVRLVVGIARGSQEVASVWGSSMNCAALPAL